MEDSPGEDDLILVIRSKRRFICGRMTDGGERWVRDGHPHAELKDWTREGNQEEFLGERTVLEGDLL